MVDYGVHLVNGPRCRWVPPRLGAVGRKVDPLLCTVLRNYSTKCLGPRHHSIQIIRRP